MGCNQDRSRNCLVAAIAPMKRGLKDIKNKEIAHANIVAAIAPMKRGLKVHRQGAPF